MKKSKAEFARQLLKLEKKAFNEDLSDSEGAEMLSLVEHIFYDDHTVKDPKQKRRSYRIPIHASCEIEIDSKTVSCELVEVSHIGITLCGDVLDQYKNLSGFVLKTVSVGNQNVVLYLKCQKLGKGTHEGKPTIGAKLDPDPGAAKLDKYYTSVYYPTYIAYLESMV